MRFTSTGDRTTVAGRLSTQQVAALGYLAGKPWGWSPKLPRTWDSLRRRELTQQPPRGQLALTPLGLSVVAELDPQITADQAHRARVGRRG